ncbi:efflux RND transporter periplasmic adaptor subunit [Dethiosulfovibrio salsuginis]|uniref:RND family efflux transporter, MFP subunit n=1 Tax=Dethiosulfovibrio salsuginis TaxID=561720 RepID=A0A1X7K8T3_9BACT|nr:efflux RND transporter periplasmic adaptor subunit [Dethiosulfovibrio salsuginis]SMG36746.1 RND family efflux transporter, MFP subunit [Dethiosulfovibrio salsuginis]
MNLKRNLKWFFPGALAVMLIGVLFGPRFFSPKDGAREPIVVRPVKSMVLSPIDGAWIRTMPGRVQASRRVDLAFRVSGPLVELSAKEGEHVKAGDVLARIDPRDFQLALDGVRGSLSQARATLEAMRRGARAEDIRSLEAQVASARARAEEAEAQFSRFKRLYEAKAISQSEFDRYRTAKDVAASSLMAAQQELQKARKGAREEDIRAMESQIRSLQAQESAAAAALADTELRAPFDGTVARRMADNFQFVTARQPILSLQDTSSVEVVVDVPESAINLNPDDLDVWASFSSISGKFPLKLVEFSSAPDPETQTYRATLAMEVPDGIRLFPGMAAEVSGKIKYGGTGKVYRIPIEALLSDDRGSGVWVVGEDLRVQWTSVEVTHLGDGHVDVKGHIEAGDRVVTAGVHVIREGQSVRLLEGKR